MKKKEFKFEKGLDTIWIMNNQIYEDFKNSLNNLEYNIDTSAGHPTFEDDDIVRYSLETRRIQDKEPICNK